MAESEAEAEYENELVELHKFSVHVACGGVAIHYVFRVLWMTLWRMTQLQRFATAAGLLQCCPRANTPAAFCPIDSVGRHRERSLRCAIALLLVTLDRFLYFQYILFTASTLRQIREAAVFVLKSVCCYILCGKYVCDLCCRGYNLIIFVLKPTCSAVNPLMHEVAKMVT